MSDKKKLCIIISNIDKAISLEWIVSNLSKSKYELFFILINSPNSQLQKFLIKNNINVYTIEYSGKLGIIKSIYRCSAILRKEKTDIVHCHLFEASLIGIISGKLANVKKRIYTRHYSTFLHNYFPKTVYVDRLVNYFSTHIIAISKVVYDVLHDLENVSERKIRLIHHGFAMDEFEKVEQARVENILNKYSLQNKGPIIGVISRYTDWKGIQYIIPAFQKLLNEFPTACLVLSNANGPYDSEIKNLLKKISPNNYIEIKFEYDFVALYKSFDIFIHAPIDPKIEAFGQIYVEALAAKIPSIFTLSGVAHEFIIDKKNALVVQHQNSEQIYTSIATLLKDKNLYANLQENGYIDVHKRFGLENMIGKFESLYDE